MEREVREDNTKSSRESVYKYRGALTGGCRKMEEVYHKIPTILAT
jgi:hypothetical protein